MNLDLYLLSSGLELTGAKFPEDQSSCDRLKYLKMNFKMRT
jgi:hypothetical protein